MKEMAWGIQWDDRDELESYTSTLVERCVDRALSLGSEPFMVAASVATLRVEWDVEELFQEVVEAAACDAFDSLIGGPGAMYNNSRDLSRVAFSLNGDSEDHILGPGGLDEPRPADYVIEHAPPISFSDAPTKAEYMAFSLFASVIQRRIGVKYRPVVRAFIVRTKQVLSRVSREYTVAALRKGFANGTCDGWTVKQLKAACKAQKLKVSGTKPVLLKRLRDHLGADSPSGCTVI